jgi:hypothetical protein
MTIISGPSFTAKSVVPEATAVGVFPTIDEKHDSVDDAPQATNATGEDPRTQLTDCHSGVSGVPATGAEATKKDAEQASDRLALIGPRKAGFGVDLLTVRPGISKLLWLGWISRGKPRLLRVSPGRRPWLLRVCLRIPGLLGNASRRGPRRRKAARLGLLRVAGLTGSRWLRWIRGCADWLVGHGRLCGRLSHR